MELQIKAVKYFAAMSRETNCFTAAVYIDGARTATVENDGGGGCDLFRPVNKAGAERLDGARKLASEAAGYGEGLSGFVEHLLGRADPQMVRFARRAAKTGATMLSDEGKGRWSATMGVPKRGTPYPLDWFRSDPSCEIDAETAERHDLVLAF